MSGKALEQPADIAAAARMKVERKVRYLKAPDIVLSLPSCGLYETATIIRNRSYSSLDGGRTAPNGG